MTNRIQLEPEAQAFAEAAARSPLLFTLGPEQGRIALEEAQAGLVSRPPVDIEDRINLCRTTHQQAPELAAESNDLLALTAYVALQSRGLPIAPPDDPKLAAVRSAGADLYKSRQGQLNLSCANCHDDNAGRKLAGATIPQAHPTGYPIYRLEWQTLGSLKRRLRNCVVGMRAEPWGSGAAEYLALEAYLMERARGMLIDAPGVRP